MARCDKCGRTYGGLSAVGTCPECKKPAPLAITSTARLAPRHAKTWEQIVADCLSETQSSINVGSNKRRLAILAVQDMLTSANARRTLDAPKETP